jgi:hypothetical protein
MIENSKTLSGLTEAQHWANAMVMREMRTPGDLLNSMHRLEARYGIPWRVFFNLRYRAPADVLVGVYRQLKLAYEAECQPQERLLAHERHIAEAKVLAFEALDSTTADGAGGEGI